MVIVWITIAPTLAPYDPSQLFPVANSVPTSAHIFGTDHLGRDVLSRTLYGGQLTLTMGLGACGLAMFGGIALGILGGLSAGNLLPRYVDGWVSLIIDVLLALPSLLLAMAILATMGSSAISATVAVGISQIGAVGRVARAAVLAVSQERYVEGAVAIGIGRYRLIGLHILPNAQPTLLNYAMITFAYSLLNIAALGFIGLLGQPGTPELGVMLSDSRISLRVAPWIGLAPGLTLSLFVWGANVTAHRLSRYG